MKVLLDTNIFIHREAAKVVNQDIGQLFRWLDKLKYEKCIHPITIREINKFKDSEALKSMNVKLESYSQLITEAPFIEPILSLSKLHDSNANDLADSKLLNELVQGRVDIFITEDKKIHKKASLSGVENRVFNIESFLEKVIRENPDFINYDVLSVKQEFFGHVKIDDPFFDTFRDDYPEFNTWFSRKANEVAYTSYYNNVLGAFLYLKIERHSENYFGFDPMFSPKNRLKIGTFKVSLNGLKIGERLVKIIFDNALKQRVDEIYVTVFPKRPEQIRLISLLESFGFERFGIRRSSAGVEEVFVRNFKPAFNRSNPRLTYPYLSKSSNIHFVSIYPQYHTNLFPDSKLNTESPGNYTEDQPHRNAIGKVYISHAIERNVSRGDVLIFYRTGGIYKGVITTIGLVEAVHNSIRNCDDLIELCKRKTVFSDEDLLKYWNYKPYIKPFVVEFLYSYSFPKRLNLKKLIEIGIISDVNSMPRGFGKLTVSDFVKILKESGSNESIIVH